MGEINEVEFPPIGLIIALQFWEGDRDKALRLARLLRNIEPQRREEVTIWFCPRWDHVWDEEDQRTYDYVAKRFRVGGPMRQLATGGVGHPAGPNGMFARIMGDLSEAWSTGAIREAASVFLIEADGAPLTTDWIERLQVEHRTALTMGKRVTGCLTEYGGETARIPHINGSLIAHLSLWIDRPSMRHTPRGQAWDVFHAAAFLQETRPTSLIKNIYGATDWTPGTLANLARETAWLASTKDDSAIEWAEHFLTTD